MSSERDDDLFDVAMWLACDKRLDADLAEFRRYDEMPCQFSREYRRNVKYILSHGGRRRTPHHTKLHASMKRVAACFAICVSLFFCSCFCFPAVRAEVAGLAVEFYDKYLGISCRKGMSWWRRIIQIIGHMWFTQIKVVNKLFILKTIIEAQRATLIRRALCCRMCL